tara:strand:- start:33 stop:290 length:258 start_codon:yes stop_codon:yes gene_type:complete
MNFFIFDSLCIAYLMSLATITFTAFAAFALIVHFLTSSLIFNMHYNNIKAQQTLQRLIFLLFINTALKLAGKKNSYKDCWIFYDQ